MCGISPLLMHVLLELVCIRLELFESCSCRMVTVNQQHDILTCPVQAYHRSVCKLFVWPAWQALTDSLAGPGRLAATSRFKSAVTTCLLPENLGRIQRSKPAAVKISGTRQLLHPPLTFGPRIASSVLHNPPQFNTSHDLSPVTWFSTMRPQVVKSHRAGTTSAARTVPVRSRHVRRQQLIKCNVFTPSKVTDAKAVQISSHTGSTQNPAQQLLQWAVSSGGVVHPSLTVTDDAPCGCRGVVAASDITCGSCWRMWAQHSNPPEGPSSVPPLVAVPEQLCVSSDDALELLSRVVASANPTQIITKCHSSSSSTASHTISTASVSNTSNSQGLGFLQQAVGSFGQLLGLQAGGQQAVLQQRLGQLQPPMLLALLLAHQRRLSAQSFWHPYISSLPEQPPCAWFEVVEQQLLGHSTYKPSKSPQVQQQKQAADAATVASAAAAVAAKCTAAADVFGAALGGISAAEVAWAYGQVVSRAFATGPPGTPGIALLPVIDMLNHAAGAAVPVCWLGEDEEGLRLQQGGSSSAVAADSGDGFWCVWHQQMSAWGADEDSVTHSSSANRSTCSSGGSVDESVGVNGCVCDGTEDQVLLLQGEELYISYMSSCDAAAAYLSFGFVPPELQ